jgi:hypothetical protein
LLKPIKKAIHTYERLWTFKVIVIRMDVQISLVESDEWQDFISDTGITVELSAPDVHAQNGAAEKSGGVLVTSAKKPKLHSGLPDSLDTEIYKAAAYMLNRSPTRRLGWLSPLGKIQQLAVRNPPPSNGTCGIF